MKISHEVPSFLLEESFKFNDFDYLLPLFWKYPEYQEHFKNAREQFEMRVHKRLIDILNPNQKIIEALTNLSLPSGVTIDVKMM